MYRCIKLTLVTLIALVATLITIVVTLAACAFGGLGGLVIGLPFMLVTSEFWEWRRDYWHHNKLTEYEKARARARKQQDVHAHLYPKQQQYWPFSGQRPY
jgi:hypothetical protein